MYEKNQQINKKGKKKKINIKISLVFALPDDQSSFTGPGNSLI